MEQLPFALRDGGLVAVALEAEARAGNLAASGGVYS